MFCLCRVLFAKDVLLRQQLQSKIRKSRSDVEKELDAMEQVVSEWGMTQEENPTRWDLSGRPWHDRYKQVVDAWIDGSRSRNDTLEELVQIQEEIAQFELEAQQELSAIPDSPEKERRILEAEKVCRLEWLAFIAYVVIDGSQGWRIAGDDGKHVRRVLFDRTFDENLRWREKFYSPFQL